MITLQVLLYLISIFCRAKSRAVLNFEKKINPILLKLLAQAHKCNFKTGKNVRIASGCKWHFGKNSKIKFGDNVIIHSDCTLAVFRNSLLDIGDDSYIGPRTELLARESIRIGHNTLIAQNCKIIDCNHKWSEEGGVERKSFIKKAIVIGNRTWLGTNVIVTAGVIIEDNCLIGAGTVIRGHVSEGSKVIS